MFTIYEEHLLVEYVQRAAALYYGLGTMEMRRLAYDYAKKLEEKMPTSLVSNKKAGVDRFLETAWEHCITDAGSNVSSTCHVFQQGERRLVQRQPREVVPPRGNDAIDNLEPAEPLCRNPAGSSRRLVSNKLAQSCQPKGDVL